MCFSWGRTRCCAWCMHWWRSPAQSSTVTVWSSASWEPPSASRSDVSANPYWTLWPCWRSSFRAPTWSWTLSSCRPPNKTTPCSSWRRFTRVSSGGHCRPFHLKDSSCTLCRCLLCRQVIHTTSFDWRKHMIFNCSSPGSSPLILLFFFTNIHFLS